MDEPLSRTDELLGLLLRTVAENLHLYAVSAAYWILIAAFLGLRYGLRRRPTSDRLRLPIVALGVVAVAVAAADVTVRGEAGITHVSLVAYLATPIGIGRYLVARWDRRPPGALSALGMRLVTYAVAFVAFVTLSALEGTPWSFDRPRIDRSSPHTIVEDTAWMRFMATVFGLLLIADTVTSLASAGWDRVRGRLAGARDEDPGPGGCRAGRRPRAGRRGSEAGRPLRASAARAPGSARSPRAARGRRCRPTG